MMVRQLNLLPVLLAGMIGTAYGQEDLKTTETGDKVIILPGLGGEWWSAVQNPIFEINSVSPENGGLEGRAHAQAWDWTEHPPVRSEGVWNIFTGLNPVALVQRMTDNPATQGAARACAKALFKWRKQQDDLDKKLGHRTRAYLLAQSAGTGMAKMVCEASDGNGNPILPKCFFERVVFISGAIDRVDLLDAVSRCSKDGVYNYFSLQDKILLEGEAIAQRKSAGLRGYNGTPQHKHIHYEMEYGPSRRIDNNGSHLNILERDRDVRHYVLPLFQTLDHDDLDPAWQRNGSWSASCP